MQIDASALLAVVDGLEAPGPLPEVCAEFARRLRGLSGAGAVGVVQRLGDCPLLVGQAGGLDLDAALALEGDPALSWSVLTGHLVARGVSPQGREVLGLGARLLEGHLARRLERGRARRAQELVQAATHALNNHLVPLFAHESCPAVVREAQRIRLQLDWLRSLRGKDGPCELQKVPAFLERIRDVVGYEPGGKCPMHVEWAPELEQRAVRVGVDLLPSLISAGYTLRRAGPELLLRAELHAGQPRFTLEVEAEDPRRLVADLELPALDSIECAVEAQQGRVSVRMWALRPPGVLLLQSSSPRVAVTAVFEELGIEVQHCATAADALGRLREEADRWLVVVAEDAQSAGRALRKTLLAEDPTFALRGIFFEGGGALPGADVRKQVDLAALLSEARSRRHSTLG